MTNPLTKEDLLSAEQGDVLVRRYTDNEGNPRTLRTIIHRIEEGGELMLSRFVVDDVPLNPNPLDVDFHISEEGSIIDEFDGTAEFHEIMRGSGKSHFYFS